MAALHNQALFTSLPQTLAGCPNDSELLVTVSRLLWWWVLWMLSAAPGRQWQEVFPTAVPTRSPAVHGCKSLCPTRGPRAASAQHCGARHLVSSGTNKAPAPSGSACSGTSTCRRSPALPPVIDCKLFHQNEPGSGGFKQAANPQRLLVAMHL